MVVGPDETTGLPVLGSYLPEFTENSLLINSMLSILPPQRVLQNADVLLPSI